MSNREAELEGQVYRMGNQIKELTEDLLAAHNAHEGTMRDLIEAYERIAVLEQGLKEITEGYRFGRYPDGVGMAEKLLAGEKLEYKGE